MPRRTTPDDSSTEFLKLAGAKLGNFRLERLIGRGRMGVVYLARDEALLRPTAVKILSWQAKDPSSQNPEAWFLSEARSVARVNHPNVVQIYGVARQGPHCYIAMEYVRGGSVHAEVAKNGPFSAVRATEIVAEAAKALHAAHAAGIVHRDVKPENLLLTAEGSAKLGDFGLALHTTTPRSAGIARAGTPHYTAPEIWSGQAATPKTDLYALGATYFYLLTGRVPFDANDLPSLIQAHVRAAIPSAAELEVRVPAPCEHIIRHCLGKSPKDRFPDCRALAAASEALLAGLKTDSIGKISKAPSQVQAITIDERSNLKKATPSEVGNLNTGKRQSDEPVQRCYTGEPLRQQEETLSQWLDSHPAHTMVLLGERESGRTTLAKLLVQRHASKGVALYFDGANLESLAPPSSEIAQRSVEIMPTRAAATQDGASALFAAIARTRRQAGGPALLALDTNTNQRSWYEKVSVLARDRTTPTGWKILIVDAVARRPHWEDLARTSTARGIAISQIPALTLEQSLSCLQGCVDAARATVAAGFLLTPDACLLAAHRANGNLGQIIRLIHTLLDRARAERAPAVSSWDVWCARLNDRDGQATDSDTPSPMRRPEVWPTQPVMEILNLYRNSFGIRRRR